MKTKRYWRGTKERHAQHPDIRRAYKAGFDAAMRGEPCEDRGAGGEYGNAYRTGYAEGEELAKGQRE